MYFLNVFASHSYNTYLKPSTQHGTQHLAKAAK